jgi:hypothetical protein
MTAAGRAGAADIDPRNVGEQPIPAEQLTIVPANRASWDDLVAIFGTADYACRCQCRRFKVVG